MSACGSSSLRHIFESKIPENSSSSSLIDSLSSPWKQIRPIKPPGHHSFTEIFRELHFKENPNPICSSTSPWQPPSNTPQGYTGNNTYHGRSDSLTSLNSESLQICTEGLGSESMDDIDDLNIDFPATRQNYRKDDNENVRGYNWKRGNRKTFPPPVSCIGNTGKPGVCFESYREDGRFVLKEIRVPTYECLHASREDGRLRLGFIQPSDQDDDNDDTSEVVDDEGDSVVEKIQDEEATE